MKIWLPIETKSDTDNDWNECNQEEIEEHALKTIETKDARGDTTKDKRLSATLVQGLKVQLESLGRKEIEILLSKLFILLL